MFRAPFSPTINACKAIAESTGFPVGMANAPDCEPPYIVISSVSGPRYSGPLSDPEADSNDRIQFSMIGTTQEMADALRDKVRLELSAFNLDAEFQTAGDNRRTLSVLLDIPRGVQRDDRGLPAPIFTSIDQYLIETTPAVW